MAPIWDDICRVLSPSIGERNVKSWLQPASAEVDDGVLKVYVQNKFIRDWIDQKYAQAILSASKSIDESVYDIEIIVSRDTPPPQEIPFDFDKEVEVVEEEKPHDELKNVGISLDPKLTFENFIVGKTNQFAHAAALRIAESDTAVYNPFFLYGGVGLGKTHLMHAIAWHIKKKNPNRNIIYMSAEKFMYQFIRSVRYNGTVDFKDTFRDVDVLMVDDIQFICGKESTQEEFFHTFNTLVDNNRQVIISADKSPSDLEGMEDRLKSRLGWGLVADIHPTTYELRLGILQNKVASLGLKVPNDVLEFLAEKIVSNVRELEGGLNRVVANAVLVGREITLSSAKEVLVDLIRDCDTKLVTIEDIQKKVAAYYEVKVADMISAKRLKQLAVPRQVAMYLTKKIMGLSLPEIGKKFGGRDHTTVLHAVKKIEEMIKDDQELASSIKYLKTLIGS